MKSNRWTTALAAAGIVTIPSILQAQTNSIMTSLSSTTLSGYVDTSAQWNFGTGNANNPPTAFQKGKADGFNLNVADVALDKPEDDSLWASGYHVELWFGPDANALGSQSSGVGADFAIRQAYLTLKTPIGNGIDWKFGLWDTIIGYESSSSPNNPNYTHSYGYTAEPLQHTGLLGTYAVNDSLSVSAGIANTIAPSAIDNRAPTESFKTYMASISYTVSTNAGWLSGSTISAGVINGFDNASETPDKQTSVYVGTTLSTPVTGLKMGASLDYAELHNFRAVNGEGNDGSVWAVALYSSFQASDKLSLNLRGEWVDDRADLLTDVSDYNPDPNNPGAFLPPNSFRALALTATAQYDLWKNVLSRVEFRWDHAESAQLFGGNTAGTPTRRNAYMLAANLIYKF